MTPKFSFYQGGIKKITPNKKITIEDFIENLKTKKPLIELIRKVPKEDKEKRNRLKRGLSYVTFAGIFKTRGNNNLIKSSGFACFDIDDIYDKTEFNSILKEVLKNPYTHLCFLSPSGNGLKFLVKIPEVKNQEEYQKYWISIAKHYNLNYNDESGKDISRACYVSYDEEPYYNPNSQTFDKIEDLSVSEVGTKQVGRKNKLVEKIITTISMKDILNHFNVDTSKNPTKCPFHICSQPCLSFTDEVCNCFDTDCNRGYNVISFVEKIKGVSSKEAQNWLVKFGGLQEDLKGFPNGTPGVDFSFKEFYYLKYNKQGKVIEKKVNVDKVAEYLTTLFSFKTIFGKKTEDIFILRDGIYINKGREVLQTETEELLKDCAKINIINEVIAKVKRQTAISREKFDNLPENLIPLDNGILNFETGELMDYSSKYYFKTKIPAKYDINATCDNFLNFLEKTLSPDDIPTIQEWFGYCLYRRYLIKKGMIFVGEQDTGKTVLLSNLIKFIGMSNTTGITLQRITNEDKFALASLYGKYLNAYDDLSSKDINNGGGYKIVTGGGYITAEYKFGDSFQFVPFAKMTFACNKIPTIKDSDDFAYYNRFMPIEFNNVVLEEERDLYLIDKISGPEELSGILNWAIEGLKRLLKQGKFSYNKSQEEVKRIMDRSGDSLIGFVQDCLIKSDTSKITKEKMYGVYSLWCEKNQVTRYSKEQVGRRLEKYCYFIVAKTGEKRYWMGADFNWDKIKHSLKLDTLDTFKKIHERV